MIINFFRFLLIKILSKLVAKYAVFSTIATVDLHYNFDLGRWEFDDLSRGIKGEEFHEGIGRMIDSLLDKYVDIPITQFRLSFSHAPFVDYQARLDWIKQEDFGNWYKMNDIEGWLCPVLYQYFQTPPKHIYVKIDAKEIR